MNADLLNAEQTTLGRIFLSGRLPAGLGREHFAEERHRFIFDAMQSAQSVGPIDLEGVAMRLHATGQLGKIGSVPYLLWIGQNTPPPDQLN